MILPNHTESILQDEEYNSGEGPGVGRGSNLFGLRNFVCCKFQGNNHLFLDRQSDKLI